MIEELLSELKMALKNKKNIVKSQINPSRIMVIGPGGMKYILQETGLVDGKTVFIPVTVLLPHMNFK